MVEIRQENNRKYVKMAVIGVGGGGNNAIRRMQLEGVEYVDLIAVNTDVQVLDSCDIANKIQIGVKETGGMGAGANAQVGEKSATESEDALREMLEGYQMVFVTCGMGGGTGTGAAPVIAGFAKEMGILTVGVVTLPFDFEGRPRMETALVGTEKLKENVDTLIVIQNEKLCDVYLDLSVDDAFEKADEVLHNTVSGISNIIHNCGTVNLDFGDLNTVLKDKGMAHIGIGISKGNEAAKDALNKALNSPLLDTTIEGAGDILLNVEGKIDMRDMKEIGRSIRELAGEEVRILWGTVSSHKDSEQVVITVIATGIGTHQETTTVNQPLLQKPVFHTKTSPNVSIKEKPVMDGYEITIPPFLQRK